MLEKKSNEFHMETAFLLLLSLTFNFVQFINSDDGKHTYSKYCLSYPIYTKPSLYVNNFLRDETKRFRWYYLLLNFVLNSMSM